MKMGHGNGALGCFNAISGSNPGGGIGNVGHDNGLFANHDRYAVNNLMHMAGTNSLNDSSGMVRNLIKCAWDVFQFVVLFWMAHECCSHFLLCFLPTKATATSTASGDWWWHWEHDHDQ